MCGIVGYIGRRQASPILLDGLRRLEYRGYDSAGLALNTEGKLAILRRAGRIENLRALVAQKQHQGDAGKPAGGGTGTGGEFLGERRGGDRGAHTGCRLPERL